MKILCILLLFFVLNLHSQNGSDVVNELRKNALPITNLEDLDQSIYEEIKNYDVILVGEMHGTMEPAQFVYGLVKLIQKNEGRVVLAMEIESMKLEGMMKSDGNCIKDSDFFSGPNLDGRNGKAWYELVLQSENLPGVDFLFFDNHRRIETQRDSSMYLDFVNIRKGTAKKSKIVAISGNIHNRLQPYKNEATLGSYIFNDKINFTSDRVMSINHQYKEGTMMNNSGNGLELKTVEGKDNFFNQTIPSKKYLCKSLLESQKSYTHFIYTERVTHSEKLTSENVKKCK
jgi:hypothetical protein